jgi:hypothetical protein
VGTPTDQHGYVLAKTIAYITRWPESFLVFPSSHNPFSTSIYHLLKSSLFTPSHFPINLSTPTYLKMKMTMFFAGLALAGGTLLFFFYIFFPRSFALGE